MNNLKYYNESLAYDFEMFMPKTNTAPKKKDNIVVMPKSAAKARKRKAEATKSLSAPVAFLMCAIFVLAGLCGNIALRLQINEVNDEINSVKSAISELDSEQVCLEVEMQRRISYSNLELEAVQLGMKKPDKENVTYIRVNDKNAARTRDGSFISEE
jgi:cell division protein FtsL